MKAAIKLLFIWIRNLPNLAVARAHRHPTSTQIALALWAAFMASWSTGIKVPVAFDSYGLGFLDFSLNAREVVAALQQAAHLPTWAVGLVTLLINAAIGWGNWRAAHPKPPP